MSTCVGVQVVLVECGHTKRFHVVCETSPEVIQITTCTAHALKYMYDNFSFDALNIHVSVYRRTLTIQLGKFLYDRVKVQKVSSRHFEKSGKI